MTSKQFDELPLLLRRAQVIDAIGLKRDSVAALVASGVLNVTELNGKFLYHKESVERLVRPVRTGKDR
jgi:hypothetical protein